MNAWVLPFGKHKNKPPTDVPTPYLTWLLRSCKLSAGLREAIRSELQARGVAETELPPEPSTAPPSCRRCGLTRLLVYWQELSGGARALRAECRACGNFVAYLPQTPENVAEAAGSRIEIVMVPLPDPVPPIIRLKRWLKTALRVARFRAVSVREVRQEEAPCNDTP